MSGELFTSKSKMNNVISIREKLENWQFTYSDPGHNFVVFTSNHGRFKFTFKSKQPDVYLDFVDSVALLTDMSEAIEKAMDIMYEQT